MSQNSRRYRIQTHASYGFYTGFTSHQEQVLMGLLCPNLVALRFDLAGNVLSSSEHPVSFFQSAAPPYDIYDPRVPPLIALWREELGLRLATISVKKFSIAYGIGIEEYPDHFQDILDDPDEDNQQRAEVRESMKLWDLDGQFVLSWGNEYWLNGAGEVVSS